MRTKEKRKYKEDIKDIQNELIAILTNVKTDERDEDKKISQEKLAAVKVRLIEAKDKLKMFMMNKTGSSAFEWHPHIGPNRRTRKMFKQHLSKNR